MWDLKTKFPKPTEKTHSERKSVNMADRMARLKSADNSQYKRKVNKLDLKQKLEYP